MSTTIQLASLQSELGRSCTPNCSWIIAPMGSSVHIFMGYSAAMAPSLQNWSSFLSLAPESCRGLPRIPGGVTFLIPSIPQSFIMPEAQAPERLSYRCTTPSRRFTVIVDNHECEIRPTSGESLLTGNTTEMQPQ